MKEKIKNIYSILIFIGILIPVFSFSQTVSENEFIGTLATPGILRKCPSKDCEIIRYYAETAEVKIIGVDYSNEWYKIIANDDYGNKLNGWMHYSLFTKDFRNSFLENRQEQKSPSEETEVVKKEESKHRTYLNLSFLQNKNTQIILVVTIVFILLSLTFLLLRKRIKIIFEPKEGKKILVNWRGIIIVSLILVSLIGTTFGASEYHKISKIVKEAGQFTKKEKYEEALGKLNLAQTSWFVKNLGVKKQEITNKQQENEKLSEELSKYNQGLDKFDKGNYQEAIDLFSEIPENSFYSDNAKLKTEEAKRKIVEEELGETRIAKKEAEEKAQQEAIKRSQAEAKAKQEELEKQLKEQQLSEKEAEERRMNADNDGDGLTYRRELELGTSDWNTDSDDDGIIDSKDTHPAGGDRKIPQTFAWSYGGYDWTWTESIQEDWFDYYRAKPRGSHPSVEYITSDDPFIKEISKKISEGAKQDIPDTWLAVSFVQNLPYIDDVYTGYNEYPKYPVETFFEKNGDCEDSSYLAASIINAMNKGVVLILLPGHMAVGVWMDCNAAGTYYKLDDRCYYYVETTEEGWFPGEIPDKYRYTPATLMKIPSGEVVNNVFPQYKKPCYLSPDFPGYYSDGENFYSDNQCNYLAYCLPYKEFYVNPQTLDFYWDSGCNQIVVRGCSKSTNYPGYFYNGVDYYFDSQCIQKARICRPSPIYSDEYWDGEYSYWDSNCTQKVASWCSKSIYYPGYFFNSLDYEYYYDYQCTQKASF